MTGMVSIEDEAVALAAAPPPAAGRDAVPAQSPETGMGLSATQLESESRPLMEEEILAAYYRAEEAYGWFDLAPLPLSGESASIDGRAYYRVDIEGIEELEDLRALLDQLNGGHSR